MDFLYLLTAFLGTAILLGLAWVGYLIWQRSQEINNSTSEEEERFLAQSVKLAQPSASLTQAASAPRSASTPRSQPPSTTTGQLGPFDPATFANQLRELRILDAQEGTLPLSFGPPGLLFRLHKGGVCAILPRAEGPEAMEYFAKRFDVIFFPGPSGETLVIERLQQWLPDRLTLPGSRPLAPSAPPHKPPPPRDEPPDNFPPPPPAIDG